MPVKSPIFVGMIRELLQTDNDYVYLFLRVVAGIIIFPYGMQKLFGWFDDLSLLAFWEREGPSGRSSLSLTALHTVAPDHWHESSEQQLSDYLVIDASDFGDMEYDPFVRKVMALDAQNPLFGFKRPEHTHRSH